MSIVRNFHFADQEAPLFGKITKSQLIIISSSSAPAGLWGLYNLQSGSNIPIIILSFLLFGLSVLISYGVTAYKIDGRNIINYTIDRRRVKKRVAGQRIKVKGTDVENLIESIAKDDDEGEKNKSE